MEKTVIATMLFADLMNSTEMAKNLNLQEYDEMIVDFQSTMFEIATSHLRDFGYAADGANSEWSLMGDELHVFLYSGSLRLDLLNALLIAVKIKLGWLTSAFNGRILKEGRPVSRLGVGINCGKVIKDVRPWHASMGQKQPNIEGYAINLTKRIEASSREGTVYQVMVGDSVYRLCSEAKHINVDFSRPRAEVFKGLGQNITLYEVVSLINHEIVVSMPASYQNGLLQKMEYAVSQSDPEPWVFFTLLRHYISKSAGGRGDIFEAKAIKLAHEALGVLEYKRAIYNILGWLHTYSKSFRNLEKAYQYFDQSLNLEPGDQRALLHRARISEMMGHKDIAKRTYEELLIYNPDHSEARRKLAQYSASSG
ncbi:MAG: hypothetical protein PVG99_05415 [Desulfobacteraceae bacterium]|jgi:class 3 adenylate cyclase